MKNANIFVDVDLTLIDANGKLLDGAREALQRLRDRGCHLFLWSTAGPDYCRNIAQLYGMTDFFEGFTAKPDNHRRYAFDLRYSVRLRRSAGAVVGSAGRAHHR